MGELYIPPRPSLHEVVCDFHKPLCSVYHSSRTQLHIEVAPTFQDNQYMVKTSDGRLLDYNFIQRIVQELTQSCALPLPIPASAIPPLILQKTFRIPVSSTLYIFDFFILLLQAAIRPVENILYGILLILIYKRFC